MPPAAGTGEQAASLIRLLTERGLTIATAESLTGGLLGAALVGVPGASRAYNGGVIAYSTALKHSFLGVDAGLLAERGAVDPEVARQMADRVRRVCAVDGRAADLGIATTGVAGPDPQEGRPPGTVFIGLAGARGIRSVELVLTGSRPAVRSATVAAALDEVLAELALESAEGAE